MLVGRAGACWARMVQLSTTAAANCRLSSWNYLTNCHMMHVTRYFLCDICVCCRDGMLGTADFPVNYFTISEMELVITHIMPYLSLPQGRHAGHCRLPCKLFHH
jgi:hypothetical protein